MKAHRFIVDEPLQSGDVLIRDSRLCHQMHDVLHLRVGERVVLCDGAGNEADGVLMRVSRDATHIALSPLRQVAAEPRRHVTLYASLIKRDNFEFVAQKAVEVGVHTLNPIIAARTVKTRVDTKRLRTIMHEASEQSGRGMVPHLEELRPISDVFKKAHANTFFCDSSGAPAENFSKTSSDELSIIVGPEGGWDESELAQARAQGFQIISLGTLTMRAETAAIIATHWAVNV